MMKRSVVLVVAAVICGFAPEAARARSSSSAVVVLSGVVAPSYRLAVSASEASLDLGAGSSGGVQRVAAVSGLSNDEAGFQVQLFSYNGGLLRDAAGGGGSRYRVAYAGGAFVQPPLREHPVVVGRVSAGSEGLLSQQGMLVVSTEGALVRPGIYCDTLVMAIVAN